MPKFIEITNFYEDNEQTYINVDHIILVAPKLIKGQIVNGEKTKEPQMGTIITVSHPIKSGHSISGKESVSNQITTSMPFDLVINLIDH